MQKRGTKAALAKNPFRLNRGAIPIIFTIGSFDLSKAWFWFVWYHNPIWNAVGPASSLKEEKPWGNEYDYGYGMAINGNLWVDPGLYNQDIR